MLFVSLSIYYNTTCFLPQIETNFDASVFFCHDAVTQYCSIREYSKGLMNLMDDEELHYEQLGEQILIAFKEFKDVNKSVKNLIYSFIR